MPAASKGRVRAWEIRRWVVFCQVQLRHWKIGQLPTRKACKDWNLQSPWLAQETTQPYDTPDKQRMIRSLHPLRGVLRRPDGRHSRTRSERPLPPLFRCQNEA